MLSSVPSGKAAATRATSHSAASALKANASFVGSQSSSTGLSGRMTQKFHFPCLLFPI